jgi:formate hydrogenlyase transcriptional activator
MYPQHASQPAPPSSADLVYAKDRLELLLEVSRAAASLELPALIDRVGTCLQRSRWNWDHTSVCLREPEGKALRVHHLFLAPGPLEASHRDYRGGCLVPIEGTQLGRALTTGRPCVTNTLAEYAATSAPSWTGHVMPLMPSTFSSCIVPLVCRGRTIGTLAAACARDGAFDSEAIQLIGQLADVIAPAVENAISYREIKQLKERLASENRYLNSEISAPFGEIVGESPALRRLLALIESVARTNTTVLIHGETGTGKEMVAHAIHRLSQRRASTFIKLNCAAIPSGLLESELFGHERGAFTGASALKTGRFELAHQGTLFLDEVGELPLEVQPKLLRVLQDQEFERVGGTKMVKVDARLIAGSFRSDLFFRLNVFPILVPPLRDRREDIPCLVHHFVDRCARKLRKAITVVSPETLDALSRYDWPGNVRELENVVERSVILSPGPELVLPSGALEPDVHRNRVAFNGPTNGTTNDATNGVVAAPTAVDPSGTPQTLAEAERDFIMSALEQTSWVVSGPRGAAARLGLSRTTLQGRMRKLGITRPPRMA